MVWELHCRVIWLGQLGGEAQVSVYTSFSSGSVWAGRITQWRILWFLLSEGLRPGCQHSRSWVGGKCWSLQLPGCILWLKAYFEYGITAFDFAWCMLLQVPAVLSSLWNKPPVTQMHGVRLLLTQICNWSYLFELLSFLPPPAAPGTTITWNFEGNLCFRMEEFSAFPTAGLWIPFLGLLRHLLLFHLISTFLLKKFPLIFFSRLLTGSKIYNCVSSTIFSGISTLTFHV